MRRGLSIEEFLRGLEDMPLYEFSSDWTYGMKH